MMIAPTDRPHVVKMDISPYATTVECPFCGEDINVGLIYHDAEGQLHADASCQECGVWFEGS